MLCSSGVCDGGKRAAVISPAEVYFYNMGAVMMHHIHTVCNCR